MGYGDRHLPGAALSTWGTQRADTSIPSLNQTSETVQVPLFALYSQLPTSLPPKVTTVQCSQHLRGWRAEESLYKPLRPMDPISGNAGPGRGVSGEEQQNVLACVNPVGLSGTQKQGLTLQDQRCDSGDSVTSVPYAMVI